MLVRLLLVCGCYAGEIVAALRLLLLVRLLLLCGCYAGEIVAALWLLC